MLTVLLGIVLDIISVYKVPRGENGAGERGVRGKGMVGGNIDMDVQLQNGPYGSGRKQSIRGRSLSPPLQIKPAVHRSLVQELAAQPTKRQRACTIKLAAVLYGVPYYKRPHIAHD